MKLYTKGKLFISGGTLTPDKFSYVLKINKISHENTAIVTFGKEKFGADGWSSLKEFNVTNGEPQDYLASFDIYYDEYLVNSNAVAKIFSDSNENNTWTAWTKKLGHVFNV